MFERFFMNRSLRSRITFLYILFAVAVIGAITFYAYHYSVGLLKEKEESILEDSIEYLEKSISARISDINEEYLNNFDNDTFLKLYLESVNETRDPGGQSDLNNRFRNYFLDMKLRNNDLVQSIEMAGSDQNIYSDEYTPVLGYEQFLNSPYYSECMENKNKILYWNPEADAEYFTILRSFYFQDNRDGSSAYPGVGYTSEDNEDYSVLIFFLKKKYLRSMIREEAQKRQTTILILDQDGNTVVREGDPDRLTNEEYGTLAKEMKENTGESPKKDWMGIHIRPIELMDWDIVYIYDVNILYRQAGQIRNVALVIFAFAVLAVVLIASLISRTVAEPIQALAKSMDEAVENHMEVAFQPKYNDEISHLTRRFRALMQRVAALMTEVKQAEEQKRVEELKALQAQINPHFLYNTLDMVYWLAKMDDNDEIANLIADLADFFSLSLNKGEDITTVAREVEHAGKYLEIQKVRMDRKFDYEIELDPAVGEERVPKLILQPFVENSLVHGFEKISGQGRIRIEVRKEEKNIVFYITDNGSGIRKDILDALNRGERMESKSHGYAVGNVRDRVVLYAGKEYGVTFENGGENGEEQGTRVRIWFPCGFEK